MKKFEAPTLEEAYAAAAKEFSCSVTELDIQIVQNPSKGFLGFGRKDAIIVAICKSEKKDSIEENKIEKRATAKIERMAEPEKRDEKAVKTAVEKVDERVEEKKSEAVEIEKESGKKPQVSKRGDEISKRGDEEIFGNFYDESIDIHAAVSEVEKDINSLFSSACFKLEPVKVFALDDETVQIEFKGEDAALLIGKEGYRYKALAYLLYNWIHGKYGYKVRLEIAEFLRNQEAMMESYLQPVIERIESEGRAQTKVLDGILVQIALQKLRQRYPEKYVAVRTNRDGGRYVIVNEFMERR